MITLFDVLKLINTESELEILDSGGYLLQEGPRGSTWWDDELLDKPVDMIVPGIVTKIFLED